MKKLIFILIVLLVASCTNEIKDAKIDNPEKVTTVEIQQNVIDSCATIATDGEHLYIMKNNVAVEKYYVVANDQVIVSDFFIFIIIILLIIGLILIVMIITNS